jgi:CheY-like chemotaxis protein
MLPICDFEKEGDIAKVLKIPLVLMANRLLTWLKLSMAESILIIEDNADMCEFLGIYLRTQGYETSQAGTSAEGIEKALAEQPDLILTDLYLPDMDAVETITVLKQDPSTSRIPVVVLTAATLRESREKALKAGAEDYVLKPVSPPSLAVAVRKILEISKNRPRSALSEL